MIATGMLEVRVARSRDRTEIHFVGRIDHTSAADFSNAFENLHGTVCLNLRHVESISSHGVGLLVRSLTAISGKHRVEFAECSETMIDQFQILQFSRYGKITSFQARYSCERCNRTDTVLLTVKELPIDRESRSVGSPSFPCICGGQLVVDDSLEFVIEYV